MLRVKIIQDLAATVSQRTMLSHGDKNGAGSGVPESFLVMPSEEPAHFRRPPRGRRPISEFQRMWDGEDSA